MQQWHVDDGDAVIHICLIAEESSRDGWIPLFEAKTMQFYLINLLVIPYFHKNIRSR